MEASVRNNKKKCLFLLNLFIGNSWNQSSLDFLLCLWQSKSQYCCLRVIYWNLEYSKHSLGECLIKKNIL